MKWILSSPPKPSQLVNEKMIETIVGNQTKPPTTSIGTPTMRPTVTRSRVPRRTARRRCRRAPTASRVGATSTAIAPRSRLEDRLLLLLDALHEAVHVARVADELLQRRDHDGGREVRPRVAVEELRDVLRRRDQLRGLLLQHRVVARIRGLVRAPVVRVRLQGRISSGCGSEVAEQRLRGLLVLRALRHHEAVDRSLDRVLPPLRVDLREREEVEV